MPPVQMMPLGPGARPPPQQQQLPAQMFTTAAQLLDLTDSTRSLPWRKQLGAGDRSQHTLANST